MTLALTKLSETQTKITLGWAPVPGAIGYRYQSSMQAPKWSHTWDATKSQVTFAKAAWYKVEALGVESAGDYPAATPPPPTFRTPVDSISDFTWGHVPDFINPVQEGVTEPPGKGGGIWEMDTPYGPGFKFVATPQMIPDWSVNQPQPVKFCVARGPDPVEGTFEQWRWKLMLPSSGNPNGFTRQWHNGLLIGFHTHINSGIHLSINDNGTFRIGLHDEARAGDPNVQNWFRYYEGPMIQMDRWYDVRMDINWRYDASGRVQVWIDDQLEADLSGATVHAGDEAYAMQFGYYSWAILRNEVHFAAVGRV